MMHEDDLRRLLGDAAESVPPPGRAPDALLATLAEHATEPSPRRAPLLKLGALAAAVVAVIALGATLAGNNPDASKSTSTGDASGSPGLGEVSTTIVAGGEVAGDKGGDQNAIGGPTSGSGAPGVDSAKIVKTGSLDLEVREGTFEGTVDRITAQTIGLGGYIAESTTNESSDSPSGSIVVRVPADSFENLLAGVRKLGKVKSVSSKGTDVTAQFTDLAARLTALAATRDRLSAVLSEAKNVPDILAVQDRITAVQVEIEQLQGQQRLLEDQTSFATLAITLGEPGAEIITSQSHDGLGQAWDDARRRFGDGIEHIVSWSGAAAVVLLVGLVLLGAGRLVWIGVRRRMV